MTVASLELSKELYELSGWDSEQYFNQHGDVFQIGEDDNSDAVPAYDAGYLLRKLPKTLKHPATGEDWTFGLTIDLDTMKWSADYQRSMLPYAEADTPEDALAKLAIELFKVGVLKNG